MTALGPLLIALWLTLTLSTPLFAQGFHFTLPTGVFKSCGDNEICLEDLTIADPPKVRLGAKLGNGFGALTFNRIRSDGIHVEAAMLYCKQDERYPAHIVVGYCELFLKDDSSDGDAAMKRKVTVYHDRIVVHVPLVFPNGGSIGASDHLAAGRFIQYIQTDGNAVIYEDVHGTPCPRWAINWLMANRTGVVDRNVLAAPCNANSSDTIYP